MAGKSGILPPVFPDFPANVSSKCEFEMRLRDVSSKGEPEIRFRNVSSNCEFLFSFLILPISRRLVLSVYIYIYIGGSKSESEFTERGF